MTIKINNTEYVFSENLLQESGVYMVIATDMAQPVILDVGESDSVYARLATHDRRDCWEKYARGRQMRYYAYYCDGAARRVLEQHIRSHYNPPCGQI